MVDDLALQMPEVRFDPQGVGLFVPGKEGRSEHRSNPVWSDHMKISLKRAIEEVQHDLEDSKRMLNKIQYDPKRKLDLPNEALHYWDGRVTGLKLALERMERIEVKKGWDQ